VAPIHFRAIGYGAWSTGNITEEVVKKYLEHHHHPSNREAEISSGSRTFSPQCNLCTFSAEWFGCTGFI
jgi:hypothetical protein